VIERIDQLTVSEEEEGFVEDEEAEASRRLLGRILGH
jgi:hypothetical protein